MGLTCIGQGKQSTVDTCCFLRPVCLQNLYEDFNFWLWKKVQENSLFHHSLDRIQNVLHSSLPPPSSPSICKNIQLKNWVLISSNPGSSKLYVQWGTFVSENYVPCLKIGGTILSQKPLQCHSYIAFIIVEYCSYKSITHIDLTSLRVTITPKDRSLCGWWRPQDICKWEIPRPLRLVLPEGNWYPMCIWDNVLELLVAILLTIMEWSYLQKQKKQRPLRILYYPLVKIQGFELLILDPKPLLAPIHWITISEVAKNDGELLVIMPLRVRSFCPLTSFNLFCTYQMMLTSRH